MPGIQLYQTEADELVFVKAALDQECWLIPDLNYETGEVQRLETTEEYKHARMEERHFFVLNEAFVRAPLSLRKITKADKSLFYVSPSEGGPFLEFLGGGAFADDSTGGRRIRPGFLTFSRRYWAADLSRTCDSPVELEEMFKRLTRVVKANSTRIKPGKSAYWLGNDARAQLADGVRLVCYEDWSLDSGPSNTCRLNAAMKKDNSSGVQEAE